MTITIDITSQSENRFREEAARAGMAIQDVVRCLVESSYGEQSGSLASANLVTDDEWLALLHSGLIAVPPIFDEALRRENMYED